MISYWQPWSSRELCSACGDTKTLSSTAGPCPLSTWLQELEINYRTLIARINRGLSFREAIEHALGTALPM